VAELTATPLRWAVVLVDLDPTRGHEQAGRRRALVVSYEAFHRSGMATVCPITARQPKYPGEVPIPEGHAGQTKDGLVLCHQVRTLDLSRATALEVGGRIQYVTDRSVRTAVRSALAHHLGLDAPAVTDGAEAGL
jgi:mRNA interferase MazF